MPEEFRSVFACLMRSPCMPAPGIRRWVELFLGRNAKGILLEAVEHHPNLAIMRHNLACYECQLGEMEVAKARLQHAFKVASQFRVMALDDEDLKPLWEEIVG